MQSDHDAGEFSGICLCTKHLTAVQNSFYAIDFKPISLKMIETINKKSLRTQEHCDNIFAVHGQMYL